MAEQSASAAAFREQLLRARNFAADAERTLAATRELPYDWNDVVSREFRLIEEAAALLRARRWRELLAQLEETGRFLGV